jgi:hypothetical protein
MPSSQGIGNAKPIQHDLDREQRDRDHGTRP